MYECQINSCPLMRRCKDDWVNATQILKCCNFPKAKRTKILEKGVQQGLHEKIQGGYGRFQGTWIPLPDALRLAGNYGLSPEMAPVLYLDFTNLNIPRKVKPVGGSAIGKDGTPVKRKYTKKAKKDGETPTKKLKKADVQLQLNQAQTSQSQSSSDLYNSQNSFATLSRDASHLGQQVSNSPMASQNPNGFSINQLPPTFQQANFIGVNGVNTYPADNQSVQNDFHNYQMQYQRFQQQQQQQQQPSRLQPPLLYQFPPQNSIPSNMPPQMMGHFRHQYQQPKVPSSQSTNDTNWSQEEPLRESDTSMSSTESNAHHSHLPLTKSKDVYQPQSDDDNSYAAQLLRFFSDDNSQIPYFVHNPPFDFNINEAIDDEGHTPLHWASSIGNHLMIHLLITKGANPLVVNNYGLNPLSKLISFNNCHELKNFAKVLDDLELCLINTDINGRTPLHYLSQFSKVKSKFESLNYYLEHILNKLTKLTDQNSANSVNLIKNVLDHQDVNGDTCLHLAARAGCDKLVKILLNYGARDDLVNVNNETSKMIIAELNLLGDDFLRPAPPINQRQSYSQENNALATPIQPKFGNAETPDTQKTTVQDDDLDDDVNIDRVNKEHLDTLTKSEDNKENLFIDDTFKSYESISTPKSQNSFYTSSNIHQPLAVISERTAESTPAKPVVDSKKVKKELDVSVNYNPKPPKLDEEGRIIDVKSNNNDDENDDDENVKLPFKDLSCMMTGMINSLGDNYKQEIKFLNKETKRIQKIIVEKQVSNESSIDKIKIILNKYGFEDFESIEQGKNLLKQETNNLKQNLSNKEHQLLNHIEKIQASDISIAVKNYEGEEDVDDDDEQKIKQAINLSKLQVERNHLISGIINKIKSHGIDSKMYKYRKLISLSCGLKVEDIDGLLDGIEESLMETITN